MRTLLERVMNYKSSLLLTRQHSTAAFCRSACQLCSLMHHNICSASKHPWEPMSLSLRLPSPRAIGLAWALKYFDGYISQLLLSPRLPDVQILSLPLFNRTAVSIKIPSLSKSLILAANVGILPLNRNRPNRKYLGGGLPTFDNECGSYSGS